MGKEKKGFLNTVERIGNKIPHPVYLFIWLWAAALVLSFILAKVGVSVINPSSGDTVAVVNLLTSSSWANFMKDMGKTWMNFSPMITVPICTLGMAIAVHSGLLNAALKTAGSSSSEWKMALIVSFIGVCANLAGDAAFIVFPPLVAMLYKSAGKNPLGGLFLGFASACVGFGANLLVGSADASLASLTEAAAQTLNPNYTANPAMGWYFMFASTFLMTIVCAFISVRVVNPRLAREKLGLESSDTHEEFIPLSIVEKKGLKASLITMVLFFVVCWLLTLGNMPFAAPEGGTVMTGYLFKCIPTLVFLLFFSTGYVYGKITGSIKKFGDTIPMMTKELGTLAGFLLICFFASQFISVFGSSNISTVIAVICGNWLSSLGLPPALLLALFVLIIAVINLFMGSASGKWALVASIFVPMFMIAGINPASVQVAYRMGDSLTNNITPCLPYLAIILGYAQQYEAKAKTGTVMAYMLPFTLIGSVVWIAFLVIWVVAGLPMGPGFSALM